MSRVHIIGAGGHARAVAGLLRDSAEFSLGFFVSEKSTSPGEISEADFIRDVDPSANFLAMGVGGIRDLKLRWNLYEKFFELGFAFPAIVSKNANIDSTASLGVGAQIFPMTVVGANVKIGDLAIINSGSVVEHDTKVGKGAHISTASVINGGCEVGDFSFVGSGSLLENGLIVPTNSFVKMGTVFTRKSDWESLR
jgi:sugar O-acyltransferase (sialic acid O-acetyltransferase NeuD family)